MSHEVNSIAVIGAGTMGSGIALIAATSGIDAFQVDVSTDQLDRAKAYHAKVLGRNVQKERMTQAEMDSAEFGNLFIQSTHAATRAWTGVKELVPSLAGQQARGRHA